MIRIMCDSACDLLPDQAQKLGIDLVPLTANVDGVEYRDGIDLGRDVFFELLERTGSFPKTSQVSPLVFADTFKAVRAAGDEVIYLALSGELSGTCQSALLGRSMAGEGGIYVVDSCSATYPVSIMASYALALRDEGLSAEEIVEEIERFKHRARLVAMLDTLEYLKRGGRVPKTAARLGDAAKLKPIITVSKEGGVSLVGAALGRKKGIDGIMKQLGQTKIDNRFPVYSIYSYGTKNVERVEERLTDQGIVPTERLQIGFVIGSHIGPGACGVVFVER